MSISCSLRLCLSPKSIKQRSGKLPFYSTQSWKMKKNWSFSNGRQLLILSRFRSRNFKLLKKVNKKSRILRKKVVSPKMNRKVLIKSLKILGKFNKKWNRRRTRRWQGPSTEICTTRKPVWNTPIVFSTTFGRIRMRILRTLFKAISKILILLTTINTMSNNCVRPNWKKWAWKM